MKEMKVDISMIVEYINERDEKAKLLSDNLIQGIKHLSSQNYNKALEILNSELHKAKAETYLLRAAARLGLNEIKLAIQDFDEAIKINPKEAFTYKVRGSAKDAINDFIGAIDDYSKSISLNPEDYDPYYFRAATCCDNNIGDYNAMLEDLTKSIELLVKYNDQEEVSELGRFWTYVDVVLYNLLPGPNESYFINDKKVNDINGTIDRINRLIKVDPWHVLYFWRGILMIEIKEYEKAIKDFSKAIELPNDDGNDDKCPEFFRGLAKYRMGNHEGARVDYDLSISMCPTVIFNYYSDYE